MRALDRIRRRLFGDATPDAPLSKREILAVAVLTLIATPLLVWGKRFCDNQNSDSLLPALISHQRLTWYFWGQNRLGNLFPFLAAPIADVRANFAFQLWLRGVTSLPAPLFVLVVLRSKQHAALKTALTLVIPAAITSFGFLQVLWVEGQPYMPSLTLAACSIGLCRLACERRPRWQSALALAIALFLSVLAGFLNLSLVLLLGPVLAGLFVLSGRADDLWSLLVGVAGWVLALLHSNAQANGAGPDYGKTTIRLENFVRAGHEIGTQIDLRAGLVLATLLLAVLVFLQRRLRGDAVVAPLVARAAVVILACGLFLAVVANLAWTRMNDYAMRYFSTAIFVLFAVVVAIGIDALSLWLPALLRWRRVLVSVGATTLLLLGLLAGRSGGAVTTCTFRDAHRIDDLREIDGLLAHHHSALVSGNYWWVWGSVFETLHRREAANDPVPILGLSNRSEALGAKIRDVALHAPDITDVCVGVDLTECVSLLGRYAPALAWPQHGAVIEEGKLPSGTPYHVLALDRIHAPPGTELPSFLDSLFAAMRPLAPATFDEKAFHVPASTSETEMIAIAGPYARLPVDASFRIAFRIAAPEASPDEPLFRFEVIDRDRSFFDRVYRKADLTERDGGLWLEAPFTVPANVREDNAFEFRFWTRRPAFDVTGFDLR